MQNLIDKRKIMGLCGLLALFYSNYAFAEDSKDHKEVMKQKTGQVVAFVNEYGTSTTIKNSKYQCVKFEEEERKLAVCSKYEQEKLNESISTLYILYSDPTDNLAFFDFYADGSVDAIEFSDKVNITENNEQSENLILFSDLKGWQKRAVQKSYERFITGTEEYITANKPKVAQEKPFVSFNEY